MIGVVADDLTGAAEIGAVGLRWGLRAEILLADPERSVTSGSGPVEAGVANLLCVDTDSRSCAAEEAARRAGSAVKALRDSGAEWIYKKVDSVLRGPVVAELEAAMLELRLGVAVLVPANPALGRTISDGQYFIHGKPIDETEFAREPEYPRTTREATGLLGPAKTRPIRAGRIGEPLPESGIVVGEAGSAEDLQHWARVVQSGNVLAAGGSGFFEALLRERVHVARDKAEVRVEPGAARELFVCGTTSESARKFVGEATARGTPVVSLPAGLELGAEFTDSAVEGMARRVVDELGSRARVVLNIGLPPASDSSAAKSLALHLVRVAEAVLGRMAVDRVYAEGGATAVALARRMGWKRLTVVREMAPGVAMLAIDGNNSRLLIIKPGSYVWPEELRFQPRDFTRFRSERIVGP